MMEIMQTLMAATTSDEKQTKISVMLKADAEATNQRINNKALDQYNENMKSILNEVIKGRINPGTKRKVNTLIRENADIARLTATRKQTELWKEAITRKGNPEIEYLMNWQTMEKLKERQNQLEKEIGETTALIIAPTHQQSREENLQSDLGITISNVVSLAKEIESKQPNRKRKKTWHWDEIKIWEDEDDKPNPHKQTSKHLLEQQQARADKGPERTSTPEVMEKTKNKENTGDISVIMKTVDLTSDSDENQMTRRKITLCVKSHKPLR